MTTIHFGDCYHKGEVFALPHSYGNSIEIHFSRDSQSITNAVLTLREAWEFVRSIQFAIEEITAIKFA